jgi:hypothetical protein
VSDDPSPWPESERTQRLLVAAGALLLLPAVVGLADLTDVGGTVVVLCTTLASALLVYGLLGWAGTWVERDRTGDAPAPERDGTAGDGGEEPVAGEEPVEDGEDGDFDAETGDPKPDAETGDAEPDVDADAGDAEGEPEGAAGDQSGPDA